MQRVVLLAVAIGLCLSDTSMAQDLPLAMPSDWFDSNPTARSFAMGFTGMTTPGDAPSLRNPATLALWARTGTVYQMHNWERGGPGGGIEYDLSNTAEAFGIRYTPKRMANPPTFSLGIFHRYGRYRTGPRTEMTPFEDEVSVTYDNSTHTFGLGIGIDAGIDLALGYSIDQDDYNYDYHYPESADEFGYVDYHPDNFIRTGYLMNLRVLHAMTTWGLLEQEPTFGNVVVEVTGSLGGTSDGNNGQTGYSLALNSQYKALPFVSMTYAIDDHGSSDYTGWEVTVLGSLAYRRGNQDHFWPTGTFFDSHGNLVVQPDWSTEGYAVNLGNAQRWVRYALDWESSPTVNWILDRVEFRYETASFRHPENAVPGLGDVSIRQWTIGLSTSVR